MRDTSRMLTSRPNMGKRGLGAVLVWLAAVSWVFAGPLFAGRVLYYRDIALTYFPDYVFVSRWLRHGLWPLWHPGAEAGAPFLQAYPVDLLLLLAVGPRGTLALSPALHLLLAMVGVHVLARRTGVSPTGALLSGTVFGLSGYMLGSVLYPTFFAAAWAPLALALVLALVERPAPGRAAALALVLALQVSTRGGLVVVQTALAALVLLRVRPGRRALWALSTAAVVAALLAAPVLLGTRALLAGSARGAGFAPDVGLSYSAPPPVLVEALWPRFFGEVHTFSDAGFWGQPFYPGGSPFFLSLYLGPLVLLLALRAGRREWRLWLLVALSLLLALGAHGPLGPALGLALRTLRGPVKFFFLATLGLSLLAGLGLDRARERGIAGHVALGPAVLTLALALWSWTSPDSLASQLARLWPAAGGPLARDVIASQWPAQLGVTGALVLGVGLTLRWGGPRVGFAAILVALDLLRVNGGLNPSTPGRFYERLPAVSALIEPFRLEGTDRWFSYGVAHSRPLHWAPPVARQNSDVWLFYLDRQSLLPRTHVLDGLEGAYDIDRMGTAPMGSTLTVAESDPGEYEAIHDRLRRAGVRWVLAFEPLPDELVRERGEADLPGVREPLRLYELRKPLPRVFWVPDLEEGLARGAEDRRARVRYESDDPHTVTVDAQTPPGFLVILDGYHPDWEAEDRSGPVPILRVLDRSRAVPTPGGRQRFTLRYRPRWRPVSLGLCGLGILGLAALARARLVSTLT